MTKNLKIAIIGGGIFGLTAAIHLSKFAKKIIVFEKKKNILDGATKYNHNRHHYGFHYPRSNKTARQCKDSIKSFEKIYNQALDFNFNNYYAIAKSKSHISSRQFEKFCNKNNLIFQKVKIPNEIFFEKNIESCYLVKEGIYNYNTLRNILKKRIKKNIKIITNAEVKCKVDISKKIKYKKNNLTFKDFNFDLVINATYDNLNEHIFKKKNKIPIEYNLQEMIKIKLANTHRFGVTVLDGYFPSVLPHAGLKNEYLFAHAKYSQLVKVKSLSKPLKLRDFFGLKSNKRKIFDESKKYLKFLSRAKYKSSFYITRAVNIDTKNHSRKSEIIIHKNKNVSIFSGKIISAETIGKNLSRHVIKNF